MTPVIAVLDRCTKLNLFRAKRSVEMTPTASKVLEFLIDDAGAAMWSLRRFAFAVGRSPRTVDAAVAELKKLGFIDVLYRRRQTSVKVLRVDAILNAVSRGVAIAKEKARASISLLRRGFQASQQSAANIHLGIKRAADSAYQGGPSPQLLALLGMSRRE